MSIWINLFLFILALWLLLRLLRVALKKSRYANYLVYLQRSERALWLILVNWFLLSKVDEEPKAAWLLPVTLALLVAYAYQEWISGWLFTSFHTIQEGQKIKIGTYQGQITQITSRHIALKQANGEVIVPFAGILWKPVWFGQAQPGQPKNRHRIIILPQEKDKVNELSQILYEKVWTYPGILSKPAPSVQISESEQGESRIEVWVSLLPNQSVEALETFLKQ
jgi:small-conductance mechanosensitive channel